MQQQLLKSLLKEEFCNNQFVQYTIHLDTVCNIRPLAFKVPHLSDMLIEGISPFVLHHLMTAHQTILYNQEQAAE